MRFSIIVPVFNNSASLRNCIGSVIAQEYVDWELLLIDDGSMDESKSILEEYSKRDRRIRTFYQNNSGAFNARRAGIFKADGDYILFLDGDDMLEEKCLSVLSSVIDKRHPDIILFVGKNYFNEADTGRRFGYLGPDEMSISSNSIKRSIISSHDLNSLCNKAIKRTLFEGDDNNYEKMRGRCIGEDKVQLLHPVSMASDLYYIPDELYIYNTRNDSVVHSIDFDSAESFLANEMFSYVWTYMQQWGMTGPGSVEAFSVYYIKNYISVYYGLRKKSKSAGKLGRFRHYNWKSVNRRAFRFRHSRLLTPREKVMLLAAKMHL